MIHLQEVCLPKPDDTSSACLNLMIHLQEVCLSLHHPARAHTHTHECGDIVRTVTVYIHRPISNYQSMPAYARDISLHRLGWNAETLCAQLQYTYIDQF